MGYSKSRKTEQPMNTGQLLLYRVRGIGDQSAGKFDKIDCIRLKGVRHGGVTGAIRRCVLEGGSVILAQGIHKMRTSQTR